MSTLKTLAPTNGGGGGGGAAPNTASLLTSSTGAQAPQSSIAGAGKMPNSALGKSASVPEKRSPTRSRIAVAQEGRLASRLSDRLSTSIGGPGYHLESAGANSVTQNRVSGARPLNQSENNSRTAPPDERRFGTTSGTTAEKPTEAGTPKAVRDFAEPSVFDGENHFSSNPYGLSYPTASPPATASNKLSTTAGLSPSSDGNSAPRAQGEGRRPAQQMAGKEGSRDRVASLPIKTGGLTRSSLTAAADRGAEAARQGGAPDVKNAGESKISNNRSPATRAGYAMDPHGAAGDAITTDTRESVSRSRRSAQVLRGILGSSERAVAGQPARPASVSAGATSRAAAIESNPLHHSGRTSGPVDNDDAAEMQYRSFDYGYEDSLSQTSTTQIDVHADDFATYRGDWEYDGADTLGDDQSFAYRHGELEWLRVPSLFYFFANVIKWNELQLQRKELMAAWQSRQQRGDRGSLSIISMWTQHRERELRTLEAHLNFSAFELEGLYLNPVLISWSKPKLRSLVASVVTTWKKEGSASAKFDNVLSGLFDAISSEEACQLRRTWVFSLRQWLGLPQHRWVVTGTLIACFVISILCIIFLAVFGRSHVAVCIALSAVLGVAVIVMYVLALFIVHHNTYAAAAATYFREAAVRAAQRKMEEEELEEANNQAGLNNYLGDEDKSGNSRERGDGGLASGDDAESGSDFTEDQTSLAVRNLRALTEGNAHPAAPGAPYYRIPNNAQGGRREPGTAGGGYYDDDMTLTDDNAPSITSRPPRVDSAAKNQQDLDRDNTLLLSTVTYEQHQEYLQKRQSLLVHETMSSSKRRADNGQDAKEQNEHNGSHAGNAGRAPDNVDGMRQLAELPDKVNITALVYCNNVSVLSEVAPSLWERMFMLLRVGDLHALDNAFKHGSERFKVILVHAPDARDGTEELRTALAWLQVERRPVFFIARQHDAFSHQIPTAARLKVPLTSAALNALLLAGVGVEAEMGSVSFPADLQPQQSPSQPFQVPAYVLGRRLGGGAFGNVFEAEMEESGAKCAVKRMYLKEDSDEGGQEEANNRSSAAATASARASVNGESTPAGGDSSHATAADAGNGHEGTGSNPDVDEATTAVGSQLREIAQEVEIMSSLQHPNIVRYYFCERDDNCISIFMELCTGGSLSSLIHSGKLVNPPEIKLLLREIVSAVAYLHSLRIVHRDLKPDNVLFRQGHAKITDFGTAVHKHGDDLRLIKGTFAYMAPETLVGEPYGSACDVWSIGCIAAEVLSVDLPQHALGLPAMCEYYRAMKKDSTLPIECDVPGVEDFLLACLRRDPAERSTAAELFYHPVLQARDTSIQTWMQEVVEQRRQKYNLQHKGSHWMGSGRRGNGGTGSVHGGGKNSSQYGSHIAGVDGFDLDSGNGSVISLDSSRLTGHDGDNNSLLSA